MRSPRPKTQKPPSGEMQSAESSRHLELPPEDAITIREAAKILRVHRNQVIRWISQGSIKAWRRRKCADTQRGYLVSKADVLGRWERVPAKRAEEKAAIQRLKEIPKKREYEKQMKAEEEECRRMGIL